MGIRGRPFKTQGYFENKKIAFIFEEKNKLLPNPPEKNKKIKPWLKINKMLHPKKTLCLKTLVYTSLQSTCTFILSVLVQY